MWRHFKMDDKHVIDIFAYGMLVYTGWRVYDYMRANLAGVDTPVAIIISLAFLLFSEAGMLVWLHYARPKATSTVQESVATGMVWLDFFGSMSVNLGDLLQHNTMYVVDLSNINLLLFIAPWVMVVTNVAAFLAYKMSDSDEALEREERRLQHAEHAAVIRTKRKAVDLVNKGSTNQAARLAPLYQQDIHNRVEQETYARFGKPAPNQSLPSYNQPPNGVTHSGVGQDWLDAASGDDQNFPSR